MAKKKRTEKKPDPNALQVADASLTKAHTLNQRLLSIWATLSPGKVKAGATTEHGDGLSGTLEGIALELAEAGRVAAKIQAELGSVNVTEET